MIMFRPTSAEAIDFANPNDTPGTLSLSEHFRNWSHTALVRPWVLHAPGAMMTVVNTKPEALQ